MTAHELARQLLAGPDLPVTLVVSCDDDAVAGPNRLSARVSDGAPTHVLVEARSEREFRVEEFDDEFELEDSEPT